MFHVMIIYSEFMFSNLFQVQFIISMQFFHTDLYV